MEEEPLPMDSPLREAPNVIITAAQWLLFADIDPHPLRREAAAEVAAGATRRAPEVAVRAGVARLRGFPSSESPANSGRGGSPTRPSRWRGCPQGDCRPRTGRLETGPYRRQASSAPPGLIGLNSRLRRPLRNPRHSREGGNPPFIEPGGGLDAPGQPRAGWILQRSPFAGMTNRRGRGLQSGLNCRRRPTNRQSTQRRSRKLCRAASCTIWMP